ncbi:MAG: universal stress protein [Chloroflexi bacterium]|nr:universal stress protein [Chloroflexota bacterium]
MLRTILVTLDGSELAEEVLPYAEDIARCQQAKVVLLRVVPPLPVRRAAIESRAARHSAAALREQAVREAETYLQAVADRVAARGLEAECVVRRGPVVKAIVEFARESGADLVAMATHGRTGLSRAVAGSIAGAVMRQIEVPVVMFRARLARAGGPTRVRRSGPRP